MPVAQEFVYKTADGQTPITLHHWVETLPLTEQEEFRAAEQRQFALRELAIERGDLVVVKDTGVVNDTVYVWKDEATAAQGKGTDAKWLAFFMRYQKENGITFEVVNKSV